MMVLTIWMKPLQRYFHILSTYNGMLGNSHFWNCLAKSCGVTMTNLSISSSLTCLSALNVTWEWMGKQKCCIWKKTILRLSEKQLHNHVQSLMNVNSVLTSDVVIFQPAFLTWRKYSLLSIPYCEARNMALFGSACWRVKEKTNNTTKLSSHPNLLIHMKSFCRDKRLISGVIWFITHSWRKTKKTKHP